MDIECRQIQLSTSNLQRCDGVHRRPEQARDQDPHENTDEASHDELSDKK